MRLKYFLFILSGSLLFLGLEKAKGQELPDSLKREYIACGNALGLLKKGRLQEAKRQVSPSRCPLITRYVGWHVLKDSKDGNFEEYIAFIDHYPHWPWMDILKKKAESAARQEPNLQKVIQWFRHHHPNTFKGIQAYAVALEKTGHSAQAREAVREFWQRKELKEKDEKEFLQKFSKYLRGQDHEARMKRLLNARQIEPAKRLVRFLPPKDRDLAQVRFALIEGKPEALNALRRLPGAVQNTPEMKFDYLLWLRTSKNEKATPYFIKNKAWLLKAFKARAWKEGHILARRAIENHQYRLAYQIISHHNLKEVEPFAEAEWLLGWLALRFLNQPTVALKHFEHLHQRVVTQISRTRAAYWMGRTLEALHRPQEARKWYQQAALGSATYYGQLAAQKLKKNLGDFAPRVLTFSAQERHHFNQHEFVKVARLLAYAGLVDETQSFLYLLYKRGKNLKEKGLSLALGREINPGYPLTFVAASKENHRFFIKEGYPVLSAPLRTQIKGVDPALVHAVIRKESIFDPQAISPAGAMGLMQIMPKSAEKISKEHRFSYSKGALIENPSYNVKLGCTYLRYLLKRYKGCHILALAAYNAGPKPADEWLELNGNPNDTHVDPVDWIEKISYSETRNYVQRVLEGWTVYKKILR